MQLVAKRAVVTGGAGFLGSHLCDRLIDQKIEVVCIDDFSSGRFANIRQLLGNPGFSLVEQNVCETLPDIDADEVWNLACPASPRQYQDDPIQTMLTNVLGTRNALELARGNNARFFQASTSEVYGDPELHPQPESYRGRVNTAGPRACYDEGKRAAEALCFDYRRQYGLDIRVARIFNTYGPRMDPGDGRVISNFIVAAIRNEPLDIYGSGEQTRSFCYVDDLIDGFLSFMRTERAGGGPVNLGNPDEITISELAKLVLDLSGSDASLVTRPAAEDDPKLRKPDIGLARDALQWTPAISLREGLEQTFEYFQSEIMREPIGTTRQA